MNYLTKGLVKLILLVSCGIAIASNNLSKQTIPSAQNNQQKLDHLPHDIYELVQYPWVWNPWWVLLFFLLFIVIAILIYLRKRKAKNKDIQPQEDPLAVLRRSLRQLDVETPFGHSQAAQFYYQLGFMFRQVIEKTCSFRATDCTLRELRKPLAKIPLKAEEKEKIWKFFEQAEYIKFAKAPATIERADSSKNDVLYWVGKLINDYRIKLEEESLKKKEKRGQS